MSDVRRRLVLLRPDWRRRFVTLTVGRFNVSLTLSRHWLPPLTLHRASWWLWRRGLLWWWARHSPCPILHAGPFTFYWWRK